MIKDVELNYRHFSNILLLIIHYLMSRENFNFIGSMIYAMLLIVIGCVLNATDIFVQGHKDGSYRSQVGFQREGCYEMILFILKLSVFQITQYLLKTFYFQVYDMFLCIIGIIWFITLFVDINRYIFAMQKFWKKDGK